MKRTEPPTSIRLPARINEYIAAEARRTRRSKSAIVESLIDEASRIRQFPGIAFRGRDSDRRAWIIGAGMDVWEIVQAFQDFGAVEPMVDALSLRASDILSALSYHARFSEEIDDAITENRLDLNILRERYPHILTL